MASGEAVMSAPHGERDISYGLQTIRFLAALGVFLHHCFAHAEWFKIIPPGFVVPSQILANAGVITFFVLSGYLMAMSSERASPLQFILHRVTRIYPGLWLATAMAVCFEMLGSLPVYDWSAALSLAPLGPRVTPLSVEWTLVYEMFFYCVVALLCFIPALWVRQCIVALWALVTVIYGSPIIQPTATEILTAQQSLAFIVGMAAWWIAPRASFRGYAIPAISAAAFVVLYFWVPLKWTHSYIGLSVAAAIIVKSVHRGRLFDSSKTLAKLGDASYGIYLLHVPLLTILFASTALQGWLSFFASSVAAYALCSAFGTMEFRMYTAIKRAADRMLRRLQSTDPELGD